MASGATLSHLLLFTNQFAAMVGSHLPLVDVLDNLAKETPHKRVREAINDVSDQVKHGVDLGDAMADHPLIFNDIYVNVVRSGMVSGKLSDALVQLAQYLRRTEETHRKVKSALSYPLFMLLAFFMVFNGMVFSILPRFESMFASFGRELPVATRLLLDTGLFWQQNWFTLLVGFAVLLSVFLFWGNTGEGRYLWDHYKLSIPIVGKVMRMGALSRFLRTFSVQLNNEGPLLNAIRLSSSSSGNRYIEAVSFMVAEDIERGEGIADSFRQHDIFSGIVLQMIASGEESSEIEPLLMSASDYFESLLENLVETVTGLINPILTVIIGLAIAAMMIASFLPVFEMGGAVG